MVGGGGMGAWGACALPEILDAPLQNYEAHSVPPPPTDKILHVVPTCGSSRKIRPFSIMLIFYFYLCL